MKKLTICILYQMTPNKMYRNSFFGLLEFPIRSRQFLQL